MLLVRMHTVLLFYCGMDSHAGAWEPGCQQALHTLFMVHMDNTAGMLNTLRNVKPAACCVKHTLRWRCFPQTTLFVFFTAATGARLVATDFRGFTLVSFLGVSHIP